jgi:hypothetical protein
MGMKQTKISFWRHLKHLLEANTHHKTSARKKLTNFVLFSIQTQVQAQERDEVSQKSA